MADDDDHSAKRLETTEPQESCKRACTSRSSSKSASTPTPTSPTSPTPASPTTPTSPKPPAPSSPTKTHVSVATFDPNPPSYSPRTSAGGGATVPDFQSMPASPRPAPLPIPQPLHVSQTQELDNILWGRHGSDEIFSQWIQGLNFSPMESTSLVQLKGGPCALIAPLQAFILRRLLFIDNEESTLPNNWRKIDTSRQNDLLVSSIIDVLQIINSESFCIVELTDVDLDIDTKDFFHSNLLVTRLSDVVSVKAKLTSLSSLLHGRYGVLVLLYTYMLTKGLAAITAEIEDPGDTFIDQRFGHGSQSLINLMLTGHAVSNVFDGNKDCGGLRLKGIEKQSDIGFLTLLEHLRYCEVGWFYKNPKFPIWLIGSETHLTILFSTNSELITLDSPLAKARRVFDMYIVDDQGFIFNDKLGSILKDLDLVSEPEYVNIIVERLDPEKLGLITYDAFMNEFFAAELSTLTYAEYPIFHYNGVCNANIDNQVQYKEGTAKIEQLPEYQVITDTSTIKSCVLTKWPTIDLAWKHDNIPSLN